MSRITDTSILGHSRAEGLWRLGGEEKKKKRKKKQKKKKKKKKKNNNNKNKAQALVSQHTDTSKNTKA